MLLPASSIRWGKVWSDSSAGTMDNVLNGFNFSNSTARHHQHYPRRASSSSSSSSSSLSRNEQHEDGDDDVVDGDIDDVVDDEMEGGGGGLDDMWIEIGCSIFKAQLVRNVTLV